MAEQKGEIVIYRTEDGKTSLDVKLDRENVWLSQKGVARLFGTEVPAVNKHIENILKEGELQGKATISKMEIVQTEGKNPRLPSTSMRRAGFGQPRSPFCWRQQNGLSTKETASRLLSKPSNQGY